MGETQTHNFHCSNDEDWVKFYAISNYSYEIETIQPGTNVDTVLDVYYEKADGTLTNIVHRGRSSMGLDEGEYYLAGSSGVGDVLRPGQFGEFQCVGGIQ